MPLYSFIGLSGDVANLIAQYVVPMQMRSWVTPKMLYLPRLPANPNVIGASLGTKFGGDITLSDMLGFPLDILFLNPSEHVGRIVTELYNGEDSILYIPFLSKNPSSWAGKIVNKWIVETKAAGLSWVDYINWEGLSANPAPWAVALLKEHPDMITEAIYANPSDFAIAYIQKHENNIDYCELNRNPHPWALQKMDEMNCRYPRFSSGNSNKTLIKFIRDAAMANLTDSVHLTTNPNIFEQNVDEVCAVRDVLMEL
jgi:hypothetical protein